MHLLSNGTSVDSYSSRAAVKALDSRVVHPPVLGVPETGKLRPRTLYRARGKRLFDIVVASAALIFLAPVMVLVALAVFCTDGAPVYFAQERVGQNNRRFRCFKFRTMVSNADQKLADLFANDINAIQQWEKNRKLADDPRVTRIGRFLRKSSLDELPQLLNVLCGSMTLVGPRPIVEEEVWRYGRYIEDYFANRPGITGVWQVQGRSEMVRYSRRVAMDVWYLKHMNFGLDLWLVLRTVIVVLTMGGV